MTMSFSMALFVGLLMEDDWDVPRIISSFKLLLFCHRLLQRRECNERIN